MRAETKAWITACLLTLAVVFFSWYYKSIELAICAVAVFMASAYMICVLGYRK